jgi:hypothetical protein
MDTIRSAIDDFLASSRNTLDALASRLGGGTGAGIPTCIERLQLVPRSEIDRLRMEISALNQRVAGLEIRLDGLLPKDPS